jgi:hypothetical protein
MSTTPTRAVAASTGSDLRSAWAWGLVALALIVGGMTLGPGEGGSVLLLMVILVVQVAGLFILAWAFRFTVRVLQAGRLVGILPLLLDALLLFWGSVGILGTFGRYFGWDA